MTAYGEAEQLFRRRVRRLRQQLGISQAVLGNALSLDGTAITRIESGKRTIALHEAIALADHLLTDVNALLTAPCCAACEDQPPAGFSCNSCGASTAATGGAS